MTALVSLALSSPPGLPGLFALIGVPGGFRAATGVLVLAQAASLDQVLTNARNWMVGIAAGIASVFATAGGISWMLAGGDPAQVERAKARLRSAAIGYGVAILVPVGFAILRQIVGA